MSLVPHEGKLMLAVGVPRMLERAGQRSTTVNHCESGGNCDNKVFGFRTGKRGMTMLLRALKSWTDRHPCPVLGVENKASGN